MEAVATSDLLPPLVEYKFSGLPTTASAAKPINGAAWLSQVDRALDDEGIGGGERDTVVK